MCEYNDEFSKNEAKEMGWCEDCVITECSANSQNTKERGVIMKRFLVKGINGNGKQFEIAIGAETKEDARAGIENIAEAWEIPIKSIDDVTEI